MSKRACRFCEKNELQCPAHSPELHYFNMVHFELGTIFYIAHLIFLGHGSAISTEIVIMIALEIEIILFDTDSMSVASFFASLSTLGRADNKFHLCASRRASSGFLSNR